MNDAQGPAGETRPGVLDMLEGLPDDELRKVVARGQEILKGRAVERRRDAIKEIQRLAREHGIKVDVGEGKRRGRPPKGPGG